MFHLTRPTQHQINDQLEAAAPLPPATPDLLKLGGTLGSCLPAGFSHDLFRSRIGHGQAAFVAARTAFTQWRPFDLGWVRVANPTAPIAPGQLVAVEAHAAGLGSLNLSRITQVVDTPTRFGFLYATTRCHVEEGQERFLLEYDPATGDLVYRIEAISRPRHPLARLAWPYSRHMQHRFARHSHARMKQAVNELQLKS